MEIQSEPILTWYSEREKGAYFAALASLATADRKASQEELDHLRDMAKAAGLSQQQEDFILHAANDITGEDLTQCLDILKKSDLRYSLVTDLIALAKADGTFTDEDKAHVEKIAQYLEVDQKQVSVLDKFVSKAAAAEPSSPEEVQQPGFLDSLGMRDKFKKAGLDMGAMGKNIMGMLGPLVLGGIAARALRGRRSSMGGMGGGMLGGRMGMGGGLGSLISGINRSRGNRRMGGMLGRLF